MNKNKKIIIILSSLIFIVLSLFFAFQLFSQKTENPLNIGNKTEIILYGTDSCYNCKTTKTMLHKYDNVYVHYKNIALSKNDEEFQKVAGYFKKDAVVPMVIIGQVALDANEIESKFDEVLKSEETKGYNLLDTSNLNIKTSEITKNTYKSMNFIVVALAGLVDGINPCAMSMLLLLISVVMKIDRKKILYVGGSFALGTFITYLFIGFNIFKAMQVASKIGWLTVVIYIITIGISIFIIYLNTRDYINIKKGKIENIKNQLTNVQKKKINKYVNKLTSSKSLVFYGLTLGILLTLLEFTCTGQVYIPTLSYMINSGTGIVPYMYLIVYNLMFILPLLIICALSYMNKGTSKFSELLYDNLGYIKLLTNVIYLVIIVILVIRLMKLF